MNRLKVIVINLKCFLTNPYANETFYFFIYIYIYICVCVCVCGEREGWREKEIICIYQTTQPQSECDSWQILKPGKVRMKSVFFLLSTDFLHKTK